MLNNKELVSLLEGLNLDIQVFKQLESEAFCKCNNCNILNNLLENKSTNNEIVNCYMYDDKENIKQVNVFKECKNCMEYNGWYFMEYCNKHNRYEVLPHKFLWINENTCICGYGEKMNFSIFVSKEIEKISTFKNDLNCICDPLYLRNDRFFSSYVNQAFEREATCLIKAYQKEGIEIPKKYCECKNNDFSNCCCCIWNYWKKLYNDYLNNNQ